MLQFAETAIGAKAFCMSLNCIQRNDSGLNPDSAEI